MNIRNAILGLTLAAAPAFAQPDFDRCGQIVPGVECPLFRTDDGGRYVVDDLGEFVVNDRVRVVGELNEDCATICQEGDGCVTAVRVDYCYEAFVACGKLVQGVECVLFEDDHGFLFAIDDTDEFVVGDRIRIIGTYRSGCGSVCHQQSACIEVHELTAASEGSCESSEGTIGCSGVSLGLASIGLIGLVAARRRRSRARTAFRPCYCVD